ncbi:terminase small subunit [Cupriavidus sp. 2SB]|uniref:terminase small subunit n=1 Tax=Cupriavidus sp. 2SB TaxID=2502199 RepID=UPI0010F50718|nr:terminase small subunit [Cupriavidus sp. 2SB]
MALTGKKQKFAVAKGKGASNKDAAVEAGYSAASAASAGSRLAKDPDVLAYLERKTKAKAPKKPPPAAKAASKEPVAPRETEALGDEAEEFSSIWERSTQFSDPKAFLKAAMNDDSTEPKLRVFAANALMPYFHRKLGDTGKKEQAAADAKKPGRFEPSAPPKLVAAGGKKV